jgi:hypothetical protein
MKRGALAYEVLGSGPDFLIMAIPMLTLTIS